MNLELRVLTVAAEKARVNVLESLEKLLIEQASGYTQNTPI